MAKSMPPPDLPFVSIELTVFIGLNDAVTKSYFQI